jgi:hypothetical protein
MTTIERRTTGQPLYNGLTETQFRFLLSGYLLLMAVTAVAVFAIAPIGLGAIATASFLMGYMCRSEERIALVNKRSVQFETEAMMYVGLAILGIALLLLCYMRGANDLSYRLLIAATGFYTHMSAIRTGEYIRARWNGFRI